MAKTRNPLAPSDPEPWVDVGGPPPTPIPTIWEPPTPEPPPSWPEPVELPPTPDADLGPVSSADPG